MFQHTIDLVDEAGLSGLHVFRFSARAGTPAARMPQLERSLVKERATRLRAKGEEAARLRRASLVATEQSLLVERAGMGRSECFMPVVFEADAAPATFVRGRITGLRDGALLADVAA